MTAMMATVLRFWQVIKEGNFLTIDRLFGWDMFSSHYCFLIKILVFLLKMPSCLINIVDLSSAYMYSEHVWRILVIHKFFSVAHSNTPSTPPPMSVKFSVSNSDIVPKNWLEDLKFENRYEILPLRYEDRGRFQGFQNCLMKQGIQQQEQNQMFSQSAFSQGTSFHLWGRRCKDDNC